MEITLDRRQYSSSKNRGLSLGSVLVVMVLGLAGLTGIMPSVLQSFGILGCCALMLLTKDIYLVYPVMLFYGNVFGVLFGISVYRVFTLLFLFITLLRCGAIRIQAKQLLVFFLFVVYCVVVVVPDGLRRGIFVILDMACILLLISGYLRNKENIRRFFSIYVICAFISYFTGTRMEGLAVRTEIGGDYVDMVRNMATFEDPNYMGYFFTSAIFAIVGFKLFTPKLRVVAVVALYAILLTSLSVTAIVVNVMLWLIYLVVTKSVNMKAFVLILLAIALALGLYRYGLDNPSDPVLGAFSMRISEKLEQAEAGNYAGATSGRSNLQERHLEYFAAQPIHKMIFGMNAASTIKTDLDGFKQAAHNEYVDWLLNVGLIGAVIMAYYLIRSTYAPLKKYRADTTDRQALGTAMLKFVWMGYALTLTLYGDYRFMLLFLI